MRILRFKTWKFVKGTLKNLCSEQADLAQRQDASENKNIKGHIEEQEIF